MDRDTARTVAVVLGGLALVILALRWVSIRRVSSITMKRQIHWWGTIGAGLCCIGLFSVTASGGKLIFYGSAITLITLVICLRTKFCPRCGREQYDPNWFRPMKHCSSCGVLFQPSPEASKHDLLPPNEPVSLNAPTLPSEPPASQDQTPPRP
jgi:hypothetical protein